MTTLLAGIAEFERSLIKARTDVASAGRAKLASVSAGRRN
jgi:hypothetical protein